MFLGTSILSRFLMGFGRVLGGQNHRFSSFVARFFDKNRYKIEVKKKSKKSKESGGRDIPQKFNPSPANPSRMGFWPRFIEK